jgi:predicted nucleotidyltransferase
MGLKTRQNKEIKIIEKVTSILKEMVDPERVYLFGSRAKSKKSESSDFDFAVDSKSVEIRTYRKLKEKIEKFSGLYNVDIVFFPELDEDFKEIILETGELVYEKRN